MKKNFPSNILRPVDNVNRLDDEYGRWLDEIYARFTDADMDRYMNDLEKEYQKRAYARTKQEEHYE
jgi:hypothetical protein